MPPTAAAGCSTALGAAGRGSRTTATRRSRRRRRSAPQVVLLDIGMPGMDGYEVARRLRADAGAARRAARSRSPGGGRRTTASAAREAGFDHHLVKPAEIGRCARRLPRWVARRAKCLFRGSRRRAEGIQPDPGPAGVSVQRARRLRDHGGRGRRGVVHTMRQPYGVRMKTLVQIAAPRGAPSLLSSRARGALHGEADGLDRRRPDRAGTTSRVSPAKNCSHPTRTAS